MKRFIVILVLLLFPASADAWVHGSATQAVGKAQIGPSKQDLSAQAFINLLNGMECGYASGATPAALNADQYPVRNFTGNIQCAISPSAPTLSTTGPFVWGWDAGMSCFKIFTFSVSGTLVSKSDPAITVTNGAGSGSFTVQGNCGQAGSIVLNLSSASVLRYYFDGTYTQWSSNTSGRMWFIRQSDQTAFNNGVIWTPEIISAYRGLKPESLRPMDQIVTLLHGGTATNVVNWNYRRTTSAFSFSNTSDYPPGTRCGGASSFCTIAVSGGALTAAAADDTPLGGWVDGEQLTGNIASTVPTLTATAIANNGGKCQFTTTDTSSLTASAPVAVLGSSNTCNTQRTTIATIDSATQFTTNTTFASTCSGSCGGIVFQTLAITGKTGGAKLLLDVNAGSIPSSSGCSLPGSAFASFTYNAVLDAVLACGNNAGISNATPIEAHVQLANLVNANLWYTYPTWANDTYITNTSNLIYAGLNSSLKGIFEWSNEVWNFGQQAANWASQMGVALGITTGPIGGPQAFQSLRVRQVNGNLLPASSWAAATSRLEKVFCLQAATDPSTIANYLSGAGLVSPGSAAYQAFVGGSAVNYNTSPNRPGDFTNSECYAPYTGGGSAFSGQSPDVGVAPTSFDSSALNSAVALWNGGNQAGAIAIVDQSVRGDLLNRVQTVTASSTTFTTPLAHNLNVNDLVRFTVSGGTTYSGVSLLTPYKVLSTPTSTTFTAGQLVNGTITAAINAGSAGSGTTSVGYLNSTSGINALTTIFGQMSSVYTKYQNAAVNALSPAPAGGSFRVRWYEGALEPTAPTTAQCTAISISSTDCDTLATIVTAWKNDAMASATVQYYFQTFMGQAAGTITTSAMPQSLAPGWYQFLGPSVWGLNSNSSFVAPAYFQYYNGFAAFSAN